MVCGEARAGVSAHARGEVLDADRGEIRALDREEACFGGWGEEGWVWSADGEQKHASGERRAGGGRTDLVCGRCGRKRLRAGRLCGR